MKAKLYFLFFVIVTLQSIAQEINLVKNINTDVLFKSSNPKDLIEYNGKFYFSADDKIHGREIWVSDGTESGTVLLKDIRSGSSSSTPHNFYKFNGFLYFVANQDIWRTDGTEQGTTLIKDFDTNLSFSGRVKYFKEYNNHLYFAAGDGENGVELWKSDGSTDGTFMLKDINLESHSNPTQNSASSEPRYLTVLNNKLYFSANDGVNGVELWESNGTADGTKLAVDIKIGSESSVPSNIIAYNNKIYFFANGPGQEGGELWVSDGTDNGTNLFFDINPEGNATDTNMPMIIFNNQLYFVAGGLNTLSNRTDFGHELWKTDGTTQGTTRITDIFPNEGSSNPNHLTIHQNRLYFSAAPFSDNALPQRRLWVTDGTTQGTTEVKNANNESIEFPEHMLSFSDEIYMSYSIDSSIGRELYSFAPSSSNNNPTVAIPDQNFELHLIRNNLDDELDGEVLIANISGLTTLHISGIDVADLTGIEAFTALETLLVANNPNLTTIDVSSNVNLKILNTSRTGITNIDISANSNLEEFRSEYSSLTALDISANMNLKKVFVRNSQISSFTTSFSTSLLEELDIQHNQLNTLETFSFQLLKILKVNNNNLQNLDLSSTSILEEIAVQNNSLSSLSLFLGDTPIVNSFNARNNPNLSCIQVDNVNFATTNFTNIDADTVFNTDCSTLQRTYVPDDNFETALIELGLDSGDLDDYVPTNNIKVITNLNISNKAIGSLVGIQDFEALQHLNASNNNLTALRMQNLENIISIDVRNNNLYVFKLYASNVQVFHSSNNLNLTCIQVNDVNATNNFAFEGNPDFSKDSQSFFSTNCGGGETYVPDDNFEQRLIAFGLDDVLDDYVLTKDINTIENLTITNARIQDLTGIQDFRALKTLIASNNNLTEFSLNTNNANLDIVNVSFNQIETANFGSIPLKNINISNNRLTTLNLRGNSSLEKINCTANSNLNELVLPITSSLKEIRASFCNLSEIDVPNAITRLEIDDNNFTTFDARNLRELQYFTCRDNNMQTLLMANNVDLTNLIARDNNITSVDLSDSPLLEELWLNDNNLNFLDLRNGSLSNLTAFTAIRNPELTCILVDNPTEADDILRNRDEQTDVVTNCDFIGQVYVPDDEFEKRLISIGLDNELDNYVVRENIQNIEELTIFTINGNPKIKDLTGIEAFTNLKEISFGGNDIANVDFSNNLLLEKIKAQFSGIKTITLPENTLLEEIDLWGNQIATIEVSQYINLKSFVMPLNNLTSLDITNNSNLEVLALGDYDFEVDLSNNTKLKTLNLFFMNLTSLDVSDFADLEILSLNNNSLNSINTKDNLKLKSLSISRNNITRLNLSRNIKLENLNVSNNKLQVLDITNNFRITDFDARNNDLNCVKVWDVDFANTNFADKIDDTASFGETCNFTVISDSNFEQALIDAGHDTVLDGFVANDVASTVTTLNLVDKNISNLSGIEAFTSLTSLRLKGNNLTTVDLSNNTQLTTLFINNNQLDRLDISNNTRLQIFDAKNNTNLTCIKVWDVNFAERNWSDDVDTSVVFSINCDDVWTIDVDGKTQTVLNNVSGLDKDGDGKITLKEASEFTGKLDLKGKSLDNIKGLQAFNKITELDLSDNNIKDLSALTGKTITLISKITGKKREVIAKASGLEILIISNNTFETLNLEELTNLKVINISNNANLGTISIKNGNNENITNFNATNTPKLTCIFVDDINANYLQTWVKDTKANFVADERACRQNVLSVDNQTLENTISLYPNPVSDYLVIQSQVKLDAIEVYNIMGKQLVKTKENKVDFSDFSSGVYVVRILADDKVLTKRIMKQ